jgi:hypothetical protein
MRILFAIALCLVAARAFASCPATITTQPPSTTLSFGCNEDGSSNYELGSVPTPTSSSTFGIAPTETSSVGSNLVAKASAGNLYGFMVATGSTSGCVMVFNATSLPGNGTVTPVLVPLPVAANSFVSFNAGSVPVYLSTGITIGFSSTCGYTLTASSTAAISAQVE